jgi:TRAP-type C4-dicarboxylate transport system permease small subunit
MIRGVEFISILGVLLILIFTVYEVSARELFGKPTIWTNEITGYLLVWFGMLSIVYAYDKKSHISVDLIYRKFNPILKLRIDLFNSILIFIFSIFISIYGYKYWWLAYSRDWRHFGMLDVPMAYTRIALPIIGILLIFQTFLSILDSLKAFQGKDPEPEETKKSCSCSNPQRR